MSIRVAARVLAQALLIAGTAIAFAAFGPVVGLLALLVAIVAQEQIANKRRQREGSDAK